MHKKDFEKDLSQTVEIFYKKIEWAIDFEMDFDEDDEIYITRLIPFYSIVPFIDITSDVYEKFNNGTVSFIRFYISHLVMKKFANGLLGT
jgi:hypothetical protein